MSYSIFDDPFLSDAITNFPSLSLEPSITWDGFRFNSSLESGLFRLDQTEQKTLSGLDTEILHLNLEDVPLPDLSASASITDSDVENEPQDGSKEESGQDEAANIWKLSEVFQKKPQTELITWDTFLDERHSEPVSGYVSEAGARTYHAIFQVAGENVSTRSVKTDALLSALFEMAKGRSSAVFVWTEKEKRFTKYLTQMVAEDYSASILEALFETIARVGITTKLLTERIEISIDHFSPSRVAFFGAAKAALYTIHKYLESYRQQVLSLLQLKVLMGKIGKLVTTMGECTETVRSCNTDQAIISVLMAKAADVSIRHPGVGKVMQAIFGRVCRPLLEQLSEDIGLSPVRDSDLSSDIASEAQAFVDGLLNRDHSARILETQQSLTLLRSQASQCPLLLPLVGDRTNTTTLELGYTFHTISELQNRASSYETARESLLVSGARSGPAVPGTMPTVRNFNADDPDVEEARYGDPFHLDLELFKFDVASVPALEQDDLHEQILYCLDSPNVDNSPFDLDIEQALPLSITPLISAQHRLLSYAVLELLFQQHHLLEHINLQRHFHFLGHASFSSRLGIALFDPDQTSGEGHRRSGASTGLRLQARDTWPPASSELRLALMGILSDSLATTADRALEGSMSFAIRDMTTDELEKCRDVDSIYALDFLRLQYKPPNDVLGSVFPPDILDKYDRVFQLLLRILRLHKLTQTMLREGEGDHKIIFEMHHFVTTLAGYCHNVVIDLHWRKFVDILHNVKLHIDRKDYERTLRTVKSQDYLRALHDRTLDNILHGMFLKKKQSSLRRLLQDIFSTVLRFAAARRKESLTSEERELPAQFRNQVRQFLKGLRVASQTDSASFQDGVNDDEMNEHANLSEYLHLRLDMSGYWSGKVTGAFVADVFV
ncbi:Spc98 family-domain-containing protein [Exophiala viscosa]|uniref:Spindle pole body component n=1 Tax=Exophiala viscosa TaxID=2486360 RepID=A0AAN6DRS3_9EURO|nr:Spc98 family-domain-containing protein [Exophiala viscosa]